MVQWYLWDGTINDQPHMHLICWVFMGFKMTFLKGSLGGETARVITIPRVEFARKTYVILKIEWIRLIIEKCRSVFCPARCATSTSLLSFSGRTPPASNTALLFKKPLLNPLKAVVVSPRFSACNSTVVLKKSLVFLVGPRCFPDTTSKWRAKICWSFWPVCMWLILTRW